MKAKITDEIKEIFSQGVNWAKLEIEYVKLTAAEKLIILMSVLIIRSHFYAAPFAGVYNVLIRPRRSV